MHKSLPTKVTSRSKLTMMLDMMISLYMSRTLALESRKKTYLNYSIASVSFIVQLSKIMKASG